MKLSGSTLLLTGASGGLGTHVTHAFWEAGASLILLGRSSERLKDLSDRLPARPDQRALTLVADLSDPLAPEQIITEARQAFGALDILINNASVQGPIGPLCDNDWDDWQVTLQVNLLAPIALCRFCIPWMAEHGGGGIINLSGGGATGPRRNFTAYAVAKTGLVRFSETLAEEVRDLHIRVNCIAPGALNTEMLEIILRAGPERVGKEEYARVLQQKEGGGASPQRAAELCVFLCSPASADITGKLISAVWDPWEKLPEYTNYLKQTDIYTLRRIVPQDRGINLGCVETAKGIERKISVLGETPLRVAVIGMWHLGTVVAGCLSAAGYEVVGYDSDIETLKVLRGGGLPVNEPGMKELLRKGNIEGLLRFTSNPRAIAGVDVIWVTYDTPVDEEDEANTNFVISSVAALFPYLIDGQLIIISSQMPVGTTSQLEVLLTEKRPNLLVSIAYIPENLQLGKAISGFTEPERVVVGIRTEQDKLRIAKLLQPFTDNIIWMSVESAEMTKHAINAFLATSVAFINEISGICEHYGADASEVETGLKSDHRIGQRAYLRPGEAFAGGTLARDLKYLIGFGQDKQLSTPLFSGVIESNNLHKKWERRKLTETLKTFKGKRVAILGLTYKPGTDTLRRSGAVETAIWLNERGVEIVAYDPAVKILPDVLENVIHLCSGPDEVLKGAHAVLIGTPWPEFKKLEAGELVSLMALPVIIDPGGFLFEIFGNRDGIVYVTIGGSG